MNPPVSTTPPSISLSQQIEEAEEHLWAGERAFPVAVSKRAMRQAEADYRLNRRRAIVASLKWLQAYEVHIRAFATEKKQGGV